MTIGTRLKNLRLAQNLTQEDLANRCELTKGFISQVERDLASPSIATLDDILEALGSCLKDFFAEDENNALVFGENDFYEVVDEEELFKVTWIVPNAQKNAMEPLKLTLGGGGRTRDIEPNDGEFFGYVLKGQVLLHQGDEEYKVMSGESFYYKAKTAHYLSNPWKREAEVIWVSNPPFF